MVHIQCTSCNVDTHGYGHWKQGAWAAKAAPQFIKVLNNTFATPLIFFNFKLSHNTGILFVVQYVCDAELLITINLISLPICQPL